MTIKLRVLCVISAICFLASTACLTGYATEMLDRYTGDDEPIVDIEPAPDPTPDPVPVPDPTPDPVPDPTPDPVPDPTPDPGYSEVIPSTVEPPVDSEVINSDPNYIVSDPTNSDVVTSVPSEDVSGGEDVSQLTPSDLISDGNFPQEDTSSVIVVDPYVDYASQYIANTQSAWYDDNYVYVPTYTAPAQDLVDTTSKEIDTDELTKDDWATIMLDLQEGNIGGDGTNTFNFIKNNESQGDTSIAWMLYVGVALILVSIFLVIFVVLSTKKATRYNYA